MLPIEVIKRESGELEVEAAVLAEAHRLSCRRWSRRTLKLGLPSTGLAAVAGATAFTAQVPYWMIGLIASVVAVLSAINTFLSPSDRAAAYRSASATFSELRRSANLLKDVETHLVDAQDHDAVSGLVAALKDLNHRMNEAEQAAPTTSTGTLEAARASHGKALDSARSH